jgi:beta-N-acetylhexosaminidase
MSATVQKPTRPTDVAATAARLVWIALPGPEIDDSSAELLRRGVGGVVLFSRNLGSAGQVRQLTTDLRRLAPGPLRIAIDHEGGHIARIGAPLTRFPSAMAVAATGSVELAHDVARAAGLELAALGIDVNLAPVVDVALDARNASVGARSYGSSPELVGRFAAATVRGYRAAGIAATAKHFPGHGRTHVDSHLALPKIAGGLEALRASDLPPFRAAVAAGAELVMVSHVAVDGLTDGLPSTLSSAVMRDLLRGELGFEGLAVTDSMAMRALADDHPIPGACVRALVAGADVVMPLERQSEAVDAVAAALVDGTLPVTRVTEAFDRGARLDVRLNGVPARPPLGLPNAEHLELARTTARRSLTLLAGEDLLPIDASTSVAVIEFASRRPSLVEESLPETPTLGAALGRHLPRVREVVVDALTDFAAGARAAAEAVAGAEFVILATRDAYLWPEERELIGRLGAGRPDMVVALRNPYDLAVVAPPTAGAAAAYADVPATLEALADALTGRAGWPGTLPMNLRAFAGGPSGQSDA